MRVVKTEKRRELSPVGGCFWFDSVGDALDAAPEDLTWHAMGRLGDQAPGSFAMLWERIKEYARDDLESG